MDKNRNLGKMLSYNLARSTKGDLHVSPTDVNEDHNSKVGWYDHSLVPSIGLIKKHGHLLIDLLEI